MVHHCAMDFPSPRLVSSPKLKKGDELSIMVTIEGTRILDEAVCVLLCANALEKSRNLSVLLIMGE